MIMGVAPGLKNVGVAMVSDHGEFVRASTLLLEERGEREGEGKLVDDLKWLVHCWCGAGESLNLVACESAYVEGNPEQAIRLAKVVGSVQAVAVILGAEFVEVTPVGAREVLTGNESAANLRVLQRGREISGRGDMNIREAYALAVALVAWGVSQPVEGRIA